MIRSLVFAIAVLGCGNSDGDGDPDPVFDAGPDASSNPRFDPPRGEFAVIEGVEVIEGDAGHYSRITGFVLANDPVSFHTEIDRQGSCRYLTYEAGFCQGCDGICDAGGVCRPFPVRESVGQVRVEGLIGGDASLSEPIEGAYQNAGPLPEDIFDLNSSIAVVTSDPAVTITAGGPARLEGESSDERLALVDGADLDVNWTPGERGDRARLVLRSPNQAHGLPAAAIIECDGPDSGVFTIPREWIEQFPESSGFRICVGHDCPASELRRYRVGSAPFGDGDIDLIVASERSFMVAHASAAR